MRIRVALPVRLFCLSSLPAGLALALLFLSTLTKGGDSDRLFYSGLAVATAGVVLGRCSWVTARASDMVADATDRCSDRHADVLVRLARIERGMTSRELADEPPWPSSGRD